jgi:carbon storage regulator
MLTMSRRSGQSILINNDIGIIIQEINRSYVCVSIKAPKDVSILRTELLEKSDNELNGPA